MKSIRSTLILSITGSLAVLTVLSGILSFIWARHSLTHQMDTMLIAKARALSNLVEDDDGEIHFELSDNKMPEFQTRESHHYYQIWLSNGKVLAKSQSLGRQNLSLLHGTIAKPEAISTDIKNKINIRLIGFEFIPVKENDSGKIPDDADSLKAFIVVGRDTTELESQLIRLFWIFASLALLLPLLSVYIIIIAVKKGLKPLDSLAENVSKINAKSLNTRFTNTDNIIELQSIIHGLNELLDRLQTAFKREQRFTMDASHELRTPLAESRTALEVALKWRNDQNLMIKSSTQALDATYQMEAIVAALLSLARADSDSIEGGIEVLNLHEIIQHCIQQLHEVAVSQNVTILLSPSNGDYISGNRALTNAILINLLTNSIQYSPSDSKVECNIVHDPIQQFVVCRIVNIMAIPLSQDELDHVFEPLWRKDKSRSEEKTFEQSHFGIGLSLVKSYCEKLNIPVFASVDQDKFIIEIQFTGEDRDS